MRIFGFFISNLHIDQTLLKYIKCIGKTNNKIVGVTSKTLCVNAVQYFIRFIEAKLEIKTKSFNNIHFISFLFGFSLFENFSLFHLYFLLFSVAVVVVCFIYFFLLILSSHSCRRLKLNSSNHSVPSIENRHEVNILHMHIYLFVYCCVAVVVNIFRFICNLNLKDSFFVKKN